MTLENLYDSLRGDIAIELFDKNGNGIGDVCYPYSGIDFEIFNKYKNDEVTFSPVNYYTIRAYLNYAIFNDDEEEQLLPW